MSRQRPSWLLPASVVVALLLGLLPLPPTLQPLRPYWLALVVAYWVIEDPDRSGLGFAFIVGVIADLTFGSLLGEQALAIGGLLVNDRIVVAAIHVALGIAPGPALSWLAPLVGMLLWPPVFVLIDALRLGHWRRR